MGLLPADKGFIEKREKRAKYWPFFGIASLAAIVAYGAWLWLRVPYLIDPWHTIEQLEAGQLSESTMAVMAAMLPLVVMLLLGVVFVVVLLWFVPFRNERRLIRMVRQLESESADKQMDV